MFKPRYFTIVCTKWTHFKCDACYRSQNSGRCLGIEFWCRDFIPILPDLWRIFHLMMCQMFSVGERSGLQAGQLSTRTLWLWCHAVVIAEVCDFALSFWKALGLPWNTRHLEGNIYCSITFIYFSEFIVSSKTCKLPIPYALMHPHTIRCCFWTECW